MKYCDDANCPNFEGGCKLGFIIELRVPKSMQDAIQHNWGYIMPKVCRMKQRREINDFIEGKIKEVRGLSDCSKRLF